MSMNVGVHAYLAVAALCFAGWFVHRALERRRFPALAAQRGDDLLGDVLVAFSMAVLWPLVGGLALVVSGLVLLKDKQGGAS